MSIWEVPPSNSRSGSSRRPLVVGITVLGAVALAGAFGVSFWWVYQKIDEERREQLAPPPPLVEMSDDEFQQEIARGFRAKSVGVNRRTLRSIERFFQSASRQRDKDADAAEVRELIDGQRTLQAIERSPNCVKLRRDDRASLREMPFEHNPVERSGMPPRIVHVELRERGQEAVVWGYSNEGVPTRWWLIRSESGWRLFDWEDSESGRRESEEIAIKQSLWYRRAAAWEFFVNLATESEAVSNNAYDEEAHQRLAALDVTSLDERVFDDGVMRAAFAYYYRNDYQRCLELCDLVKRPQIRPDVERMRAFCLQQLERWEEAAQAVERYERLLGPTPVVLAVRARAMARLHRTEEAQVIWRRVLSVSPDDFEALSGWAESLPDDRKHELIEHLGALPRFQQPAQQLVERLCAVEDEAGVRAVAEWLVKAAPDTRESLTALADLKRFDEEFAAAAELYRKAYAKAASDEERSSLLHSYLSAMAAAGRQVEAHRQSPDRQKTLQMLWWDYGDDDMYELQPRHLQEIAAAHRQSDPHDPLLAEIEASLCADEGRHADAERILSAALDELEKQPDAEQKESLQYDLYHALLNQGKWREALKRRPPSWDSADMTDRLIALGRLPEARAMVDHLEQAAPADVTLAVCRALVLQADGKYDQAWNALPRPVFAEPSDQSPDWQLNNLISELVAHDESLLDRFAARHPDGELWNSLAQQLRAQERWAALANAVALWRTAHPTDSNLLYWDALVKMRDKDHAAVATLLTQPLSDSSATKVPDYRRAELHLLLIESLLALGRAEQARRHGELVLERESRQEPLLLVLLAAGEAAAIEQVAARPPAPNRSWWSLPFHEPRFAGLLADPQYLPLRRSHPPLLEYNSFAESVILLLPPSEPLAASDLQERLAAAIPGVSFKPLPLLGGAPQTESFEGVRGNERWLIHLGGAPCLTGEGIAELAIESPPLRAAVASHRAWLEISRDRGPASTSPSAAALVAALKPPPGTAVYCQSASRLALWDDSLAKRLAAWMPGDELADVGEAAYFAVHFPEQQPVSQRSWRKFRRAFRQRGPESEPFRVQVEVTQGGARERLWFTVTRLDGDPSPSQAVIGAAESDSLLHRALRAGEPRRIGRDQVLAVDPFDPASN